MRATNFVAFNRSQLRSVAEDLGFKFKGAKMYRKGKGGERAKCQTCQKPLTTRNTGTFAKGKRKGEPETYCDNFVCLGTWVAANKLGDEPKPKKKGKGRARDTRAQEEYHGGTRNRGLVGD